VVRGLAPVRQQSRRKSIESGLPARPQAQNLGPLRSPTGASPLATVFVSNRNIETRIRTAASGATRARAANRFYKLNLLPTPELNSL